MALTPHYPDLPVWCPLSRFSPEKEKVKLCKIALHSLLNHSFRRILSTYSTVLSAALLMAAFIVIVSENNGFTSLLHIQKVCECSRFMVYFKRQAVTYTIGNHWHNRIWWIFSFLSSKNLRISNCSSAIQLISICAGCCSRCNNRRLLVTTGACVSS